MQKESVQIRGAQINQALLSALIGTFKEHLEDIVRNDIIGIRSRAQEVEIEERVVQEPGSYPFAHAYSSEELYRRALDLESRLGDGSFIEFPNGMIVRSNGRRTEWGPVDPGQEPEAAPPLTGLFDVEQAEIRMVYPSWSQDQIAVDILYSTPDLYITVTSNRPFQAFIDQIERIAENSVSIESKRKLQLLDRVFIGHGGDNKWKLLQKTLQDSGFEVVCFESEDRIGSSTFYEVQKMISQAKVAVIFMTATDEMVDGIKRARQNVIHEIGFAQGLLGADMTIVVREESAQEFSNMAGVTQILVPDGDVNSKLEGILAAVSFRMHQRNYPGSPAM